MNIVYDDATFREAFKSFANEKDYPTDVLSGYWDVATLYISSADYGYLNGTSRARAIDLLTAHLANLQTLINSGDSPALVQASTVDKVSVTLTPPPADDAFKWWLQLTPYGAQLAALLSVKAVGGLYVSPPQWPRGLR